MVVFSDVVILGIFAMKKLLLGTAGVIALGLAGPASAADLPARTYTKAPPVYVAPMYDWSGFYIGANGGWGQARRNPHVDLLGVDVDLGSHTATGAVAGGQFGYRWQTGAWVFGLEAQGNWADIRGSHDLSFLGVVLPGVTANSELDAFGLFTGQLGYAWNNVLIYAKGGAAIASNRHNLDVLGVNVLTSSTSTRWSGTVGAGLEYGFAPNWSVAIEYDHIFLGNRNVDFRTVPGGVFFATANIRGDVDIVTARLNYRFGGPVVAKY